MSSKVYNLMDHQRLRETPTGDQKKPGFTQPSREKFALLSIFFYSVGCKMPHCRIGVVGVTEASVVIAVSSPHRRDALDAVNFAIEELKARDRPN